MQDFLLLHSKLPGPRANLELAYAFTASLKSLETMDDEFWDVLLTWAKIDAIQTQINSQIEFIPFCVLQGLGGIHYKVSQKKKDHIVDLLKTHASDSRWRVREAAAMGFQCVEEIDFPTVELIFSQWIYEASLIESRCIVAALAHSPILGKKNQVLFCLETTDVILNRMSRLDKTQRKSEEFRVLKKGLEYAISVFVAKLPVEGFAFMEKWACNLDDDIKKIIKTNLGKSRLSKKYSRQVEQVFDKLKA